MVMLILILLMMIMIILIIISSGRYATARASPKVVGSATNFRPAAAFSRKTDSIHHHHHQHHQHHQHHHHPEGVVYRGFCLNSSTIAVSKGTSRRRWWCIESFFPFSESSEQAQSEEVVIAIVIVIVVVIVI